MGNCVSMARTATRPRGKHMMIEVAKMAYWIESRSRWTQLKALGSSSLVRTSVLMPAFGYILLLNENVHQFLTVKYDGVLLHYIPQLWRIWLLFYGSFALAAGSILYSAFCPDEIKRYQSSFEFSDAETKHQVNLGQFQAVERSLATAYSCLPNRLAKRIRFTKLDPTDRHQFGTDIRTQISNMLVHEYQAYNLSKPTLRSVLLLLFYAGFVFLAVPAALTFIQVTFLASASIF
jgi:hypothetical protein